MVVSWSIVVYLQGSLLLLLLLTYTHGRTTDAVYRPRPRHPETRERELLIEGQGQVGPVNMLQVLVGIIIN